MNKYQVALNTIKPTTSDEKLIAATHTLQELVDRATPKKPIYRIPDYRIHTSEKFRGEPLAHCPTCDRQVNWKQGCENNKCRQAIEWSGEE